MSAAGLRLLVAGGGTGGHLFPGVAVADHARLGHASVLFVGSRVGIESRVVPSLGYPFIALEIRGARGGGWRSALAFLGMLPRAVWGARQAIRSFAPDVVLGVGGYGSVPVALAARMASVPIVIMEQNVRPGMANRVLSRIAARVCITFAESEQYFSSRNTVLTGNPVRPMRPPATGGSAEVGQVLVVGGSLGAATLNSAMVDAAAAIHRAFPRLQILHQTGRGASDAVRAGYSAAGVEATVQEFIDDMASAYESSSVVVARAGSSTLCELASAGLPAILVPYPWAADDHQRANAEAVVEDGAALMILDRECDGARLAATLVELLEDGPRRERMSRAARQRARPQAVEDVWTVCRAVAGEVEG